MVEPLHQRRARAARRRAPPSIRADLIFYGLDHSGACYEAQVFMAARGVGGEPDREHRAYVGSFFILGHGGCFGDVGHCDIPAARDPFDLRPPHQLEPAIADRHRHRAAAGDARAGSKRPR